MKNDQYWIYLYPSQFNLTMEFIHTDFLQLVSEIIPCSIHLKILNLKTWVETKQEINIEGRSTVIHLK